MRRHPLATLVGLIVLFVFVVFFGRSFDRFLPWVAAGVFIVLINILSGSLALQWNRKRRRLQHEEMVRATRAEIARALAMPLEATIQRALRERDPMDLYRAGADLSLDQQQALRAMMRGMELDRAAVRRAAAEPAKWKRIEAVRMLSWIGSEVAVPFLAVETRSNDHDTRLASAEALASIDAASAYTTLFEALKEELLTASRLATFMESSAYSGRVRELASQVQTESATVRFWVAYLLGQTTDPEAVAPLLYLAADSDLDVRANAAEALGAFSDREDVRTMLIILMKDAEWPVRSHAAKAVGSAGETYGPQLVGLLRDPNWWVRQNAASALERIGAPAIPLLLALLDDDDRFARNKAAEVLVRLGFVRTLVARLKDGEASDDALETLVKLAMAGATGRVSDDITQAPVEAQLQLMSALPTPAAAELSPLLRDLAASSSEPVALAAERLASTIPA